MLGDLNKLKVVELKAELSNRGLDTKGVKAVLVDRLRAALEEEGGVAVTVGSIASGSEDHRSSQESNEESDDVSSTPSRRGRRATSTREASPPPEQQEVEPVQEQQEVEPVQEQQEVEPVQEQPVSYVTSQPTFGEAFGQDSSSTPTPQDDESSDAGNAEVEPVQQVEDLSESGNVDSDQVQQGEESSESKYSDEQQEASPPEQSAVEESQSSFATNQEDSQTFSVEPVGDSQSSLPDFQGDSQPAPAEVDGSSDVKVEVEPPQLEVKAETLDVKVEPLDRVIVKQEDEAVQETQGAQDAQDAQDAQEAQGAQDVQDDVKDESLLEGSKRVRRSRFTDNDEVFQTTGEVKEEPMETDATSVDADSAQVKIEPSNDRKRRRSSSRSPRRRSRSPPVKRQDDEPEIDDSAVLLSWYDSDLNLVIEKDQFLTATPMSQQGFGYVWAGARASFGFLKGKVCYEVKCVEQCDVQLEDEPNPHVLRVGWSVQGTSMQLGEEKLSYGYGGTGKGSVHCQFKDYGKAYGVEDTVTAYLDMDSEPKILSFAVNGESQGVAYEISSEALEGKALFPHILSKNMKFSVKFCGEPSFPLLEGFSLCGDVPLEDRVAGPRRPEKREDCEMIMMCGLPGAGKTHWTAQYTSENPDKLYNVLGTNNLIDKMKVMGLPRKRNYSGRWDILIEKCTKCLNKLLDVAGRRRRNYILDQTNVYPSAVRRKMRSFDGFKRRAVVIVPADDEFQRRVAKREAEEGKDVPDTAVLEMKANFKLPEVGEIFSEVTYLELSEEEARPLVEKYREEAKEKGFVAQTQQPKRFKSERSGSSGDRRFDDRHSSRDGRDHRDRRDYRERDRDREHRDRGSGYRPRGGPNDRNRSGGWQPRGGPGGGGWRDRNDGYRGGRGDSRGSWRSGGGRGGMGGGYDRHRGSGGGGGGYGQGRGGYGGRGGSKGWGYNQGSGGSSWGNWSQQPQQDYSQQWQGQGQSQTSGYSTGWKGYGQQQTQQQQPQGYSTQAGYAGQGYSSNSYGNGSSTYNWNQQYYQSYGGWGQQQAGATAATGAVAGSAATTGTTVAATGATSYDPYQWNQFPQYGYSTSTGAAAAGATGTSSHGGK